MRKLLLVMPVLLIFGMALPAFAASGGAKAQIGQQDQQQDRVQDPTTRASISPSPTGNQVQNQNQIKIQNQGEETQLQVAIFEMEQLMNMDVAGQILGNQIKTIAQEQVQAQTETQNQLKKLESKSGFMKMLFGPDYGAIKNLEQQMEQNRLRIQQLTELQNQVVNQADEIQLEEAIKALTDQNTSLEEQINTEEQIGSIFGWLVRLFVN